MFGVGGKFLELGGAPSGKDVEGVSNVFTDMVDPLLDEDSIFQDGTDAIAHFPNNRVHLHKDVP